jgi:hypothetical protein
VGRANEEKWQTRKDSQCFVESGPFCQESRRLLRVADSLFFRIATLTNWSVHCCGPQLVAKLQRKELQTLIMNLSSLNVDVLLYLMKFVEPVDRFNLVISGILKGFENVNEGINLHKRYFEHFIVVQWN